MTKIQESIENADNAYYAAEYDRAIVLYNKVLNLSPKNKHAEQYLQKAEEMKKLIADADDAYYGAEYAKAIRLYKQVLVLSPNHKHAQQQLRKATRNRLSKNSNPEAVPAEALRLYYRTRSFIAAGDFDEARKLLKQAIDIALDAGADFPLARELLGNIKNTFKAEEFKRKAFEELDLGQWPKAEADLKAALALDPTDDAVQTLKLHLHDLLKAKHLINNLNAENVDMEDRSTDFNEIRKIIKLTSETTELNKLWEVVVDLFGEYNKKKKREDGLHRDIVWGNIAWALVFFIAIAIVTLSSLYLLPHKHPVIACPSENGLEVALDYPYFIANGDTEEIKLIVTNIGNTEVDGFVLLNFKGAKVRLDEGAKITFEGLVPSEQTATKEIHYSLKELYQSGHFMNFNAVIVGNNAQCISKDYFILVSPVYSLRKLVGFLLGVVSVILVGIFKDRIKEGLEKLLPILKRKSV